MNNLTNRELYLLTECMDWQTCSHTGCKARREIERLERELSNEKDLTARLLDEIDWSRGKLEELERANVGLATESERLKAALDNLVGAVGALSDPEDQLSCIPAGPEAEELWHAWKAGETALSGEPTSAVETSK